MIYLIYQSYLSLNSFFKKGGPTGTGHTVRSQPIFYIILHGRTAKARWSSEDDDDHPLVTFCVSEARLSIFRFFYFSVHSTIYGKGWENA